MAKAKDRKRLLGIPWELYEEHVQRLAGLIEDNFEYLSSRYYDGNARRDKLILLGVPRGGIILAGVLAHKLASSELNITVEHVSPCHPNVAKHHEVMAIIVDDVVETGETLAPFLDFPTATLHVKLDKRKPPFLPDLYVKGYRDTLIVYPYEDMGEVLATVPGYETLDPRRNVRTTSSKKVRSKSKRGRK